MLSQPEGPSESADADSTRWIDGHLWIRAGAVLELDEEIQAELAAIRTPTHQADHLSDALDAAQSARSAFLGSVYDQRQAFAVEAIDDLERASDWLDDLLVETQARLADVRGVLEAAIVGLTEFAPRSDGNAYFSGYWLPQTWNEASLAGAIMHERSVRARVAERRSALREQRAEGVVRELKAWAPVSEVVTDR